MRAYLVTAIVLVLVVSFASKMFLFKNPAAEVRSPAATTASMNIFQMHLDHPAIRHLPEQTVKEPF